MHEFDVGIEELGLLCRTGDAIEEEELLVGEIPVGGDKPFHVVVPDPYGDLVGKEMAFTRIRMEQAPCRGLGGEAPEDVSGGEVEVVAGAAEGTCRGFLSRSREGQRSRRNGRGGSCRI